MKTNNNNNETRNGMANLIKYAAELLTNGATVESTTKHGFEFREIRKGNEYVCLCLSDFAKAQEIANAPAEEVEVIGECTTAYHHTTAARVAQVCKTIAEAVGVFSGSQYPAADMVQDLNRFAKWEISAEANEEVNPAAPFWFAVRKQGSESGTREHCKERCAVLGRPVYVIKVEREELPGLFTLKVRVSSPATAEKVTEAANATEKPQEPETPAEAAVTTPARLSDYLMHGHC